MPVLSWAGKTPAPSSCLTHKEQCMPPRTAKTSVLPYLQPRERPATLVHEKSLPPAEQRETTMATDQQPKSTMPIPVQGTTMVGGVGTPDLHYNYVQEAMEHLTVLSTSLEQMGRYASVSMMGPREALRAQMQRLVLENPAYRDAAALLFAGVQAE